MPLARGDGAAVRREGELSGVGVFDLNEELSESDCAVERHRALVFRQCGDGVQCVAKNAPGIPTYPSNNTMYLGEAVRFGVWEEACHFCGDCVLGQTGGICPVTQCAKSLVNGPCGGQKNGKCEVNPENDCAWIKIYKRLDQIGQLDKLGHTREDKGYAKFSYPRTISLKGKK